MKFLFGGDNLSLQVGDFQIEEIKWEIVPMTEEEIAERDKKALKKERFYYGVSPVMKNVTKEEFQEYIRNYPRKLDRDVFGACEPPSVTYNDFELADRWPYSVVASTFLYDNKPGSYYYEPEEKRTYKIMINVEEVFASHTGNKTED